MYKFIVLCGLAMMVKAQGPTGPIAGAVCNEEGNKAVDDSNMCWYHECVMDEDGGMSWLPRRCAWMSRVSYNFVQGQHNPCTVNILAPIGNPCDRTQPSVDGPPACHDEAVRMECQNGGQNRYEADKCWCECPATWQGDNDCSKPTQETTGAVPGSDICVDGEPLDDWCTLAGGCLNGGTCFNQCDTFWCDCGEENALDADHVGKRCEIFGQDAN